MVVSNAQGTLGIVIRHDGKKVRLVAMKPGRLGVSRLTREKFEAEWRDVSPPLEQILATFLVHAHQQGASVEALKGLETLAQRDRCVVSPLF